MLNKFIFHAHAWLGFICSLFLLAVAITGIAFALSGPLLHIETGAFPSEEARSPDSPVNIERHVEAAKKATSAAFIPLGYIGGFAEIETPIEMVYGLSSLPEQGGEVQIVTFNPNTDDIIDSFYLDRTITHHIIDFHYTLLLGNIGLLVMAVVGILMAIMAVLGIVMWWPRRFTFLVFKRKALYLNLRASLTQINFNLHSVIGFWGATAIIVWGLTGAFWSKPDWQPSWMLPNTDSLPADKQARLETMTCEATVTISDAVAIAREKFPNAVVLEAEFPVPWQPYHILYLSNGNDVDTKDGDTRVWVSASCKDIVHVEENEGLHLVGAANNSVHAGTSFGIMRLPIILSVGLALIFLSVTGLVLWWRRYIKSRVIPL
ncbi:PepSY-associated TM helix domain-containing protein [Glaciecola siphonariae]|uniref:PepSY-associated TM helix domain-containing protein n=1 Tax=Glaciecola siphonariae TaxID=521012 RepID=A0ABV9LRN1_9ALTE